MVSLKQRKQNIHQAAFDKGAEALCNADLKDICSKSGARFKDNKISISYFNKEYRILLPEIRFDPADLAFYEQILLLHYLTHSETVKTKGEYVTFRDLPDGMFYYSAFRRNGPHRILTQFGMQPEKIISVAQVLGGNKTGFGDVSVEIEVFPKIRAVIVLYRGDQEFPPEASILFKDNIINYLPLEDIAVLGGIIAGRFKKAYKSL